MIRTSNVFRQLSKGTNATLLAVSHNFDPDSVDMCEKEFDAFSRIDLKPYTAFPDRRGRFLKKWHMHWPLSQGIQADEDGQRMFSELAQQHDVVWFHTLGAAQPFKDQPLPCSVMDLDDLNHCKYDLRSRHDANFRFRCSAKVQAYKWKRHEFDALKKYDIVVVCSEDDQRYLQTENIRVIPNGFTLPQQEPAWTKPDPNRLGFIGVLGYGPNYDGLVWFRDKVWPIIRKQSPQMKLRIIGSLPPEKYYVKADGFEYLGYVEDTTDEMNSWSSMIVPIPYGGGTRIKILDAFSKKCPVIATPIGAHGIQGMHREHLLMTESPDEFAKYCLDLSSQPEQGKSLAEAGWKLFQEKYSWDVIGKSIRDIVSKVVG
jgi:glycosyltransferase involved in cell wall biosynthesis